MESAYAHKSKRGLVGDRELGTALRGECVWGGVTPPGPVSVGKIAISLGKIVEFP